VVITIGKKYEDTNPSACSRRRRRRHEQWDHQGRRDRVSPRRCALYCHRTPPDCSRRQRTVTSVLDGLPPGSLHRCRRRTSPAGTGFRRLRRLAAVDSRGRPSPRCPKVPAQNDIFRDFI